MPFGQSVAKAFAKADDIERKLFLRKSAVGEPLKLRLYNGSTFLGEIDRRGWNLGQDEKIEFQTGARYYPLFIHLIDDPDGGLLQALKSMTKVRVGSIEFGILSKPSFLSAVPSYTFKVQAIGES